MERLSVFALLFREFVASRSAQPNRGLYCKMILELKDAGVLRCVHCPLFASSIPLQLGELPTFLSTSSEFEFALIFGLFHYFYNLVSWHTLAPEHVLKMPSQYFYKTTLEIRCKVRTLKGERNWSGRPW